MIDRRTHFRWKTVMRWDPHDKILRIGRFLWQKGRPGFPGGGYSAKFSISLTPKLVSFKREWWSCIVTLCGVRLHYMRSYGGIIP